MQFLKKKYDFKSWNHESAGTDAGFNYYSKDSK